MIRFKLRVSLISSPDPHFPDPSLGQKDTCKPNRGGRDLRCRVDTLPLQPSLPERISGEVETSSEEEM